MLVAVLFSVAAISFVFIADDNQKQVVGDNESRLETPLLDHSELTDVDKMSRESPAVLPSTTAEVAVFEREEINALESVDPLVDSADFPPLLTEQQIEYQAVLEQKVNGQVQVIEPLLPVILRSKEFSALTKSQKNTILNQLMNRLNSGELRPQDIYPNWPQKN